MRYLVTGAAGFIGFHTSKQLLEAGHEVIGLDNVNDYYDPRIKYDRLSLLEAHQNFDFHKRDLVEGDFITELVTDNRPDRVIHLAAQAGVRYSIDNPQAYVQSNIVGFLNILEACKKAQTPHLTYASSSSVYGANTAMPFSIHQNVDHPLALYGATKKANELMAHSYSNLYELPTTGLRFFTVYGPYGRPDMALFMFTRNIIEGKPIDVFNYGNHRRDFTYVDDIVEGVIRTMDNTATANDTWDSNEPDPGTSKAPYRIYNIGNQEPIELMRYIEVIEDCLGKKAEKNLLPLQAGDVPDTYADASDLMNDVGYKPSTPIETGVKNFVDWYLEYYKDELQKSA
jgi:UDP-glucuronate 4-epimerase